MTEPISDEKLADLRFWAEPIPGRSPDRDSKALTRKTMRSLLARLDAAAVYGKSDGRRLWTREDGTELRVATLERAREAMDMPWADWQGVREAIPPAYTEHIGRQLLAHLQAEVLR